MFRQSLDTGERQSFDIAFQIHFQEVKRYYMKGNYKNRSRLRIKNMF